MHDRKIGMTIFLLKDQKVADFENELLEPFVERSIPLSDPFEGVFIPFPASDDGVPAWVEPVTSILTQPLTEIMNAKAPGGLLVLRHAGRTFVVTFGHAWQKLHDSWLEVDFGLRVAINVIPRKEILEIRAEQVFAKWHLASERAPRASSLEEFGVDFNRDLVAVLEGVPENYPKLGKTLRGSTSLKVQTQLIGLINVLDIALDRFGSMDYKGDWPEIDNISPERDPIIVEFLESQLDSALQDSAERSKIVMFTPSQKKGEPFIADSYVYGRLSKTPVHYPYLKIESWVNYLAHKSAVPSLAEAKQTHVHMYDDSGLTPKDVTAFDCFGYEYADKDCVYILSSGVWYTVSNNFIQSTNRSIGTIPPPLVNLLKWNGADDEATYNAACSTTEGFLNCDAKNIFFGGGRSQLEFCDMLCPKTKTLLFAKIASRSSGMSHLFEQVRTTASLLFGVDNSYRQKLSALFATHYPGFDTRWLQSRPRREDWNLCMVSLGRTAPELPFLARCSLARIQKDLLEQGHSVSFIGV